MITFLKRSGWKVLLLLIAAAAIPACADHNYRGDNTPPPSTSPHGQQGSSGPTP